MSSRPPPGRELIVARCSNGRQQMNKAVLLAAALILVPLPTLSQEVQRSETPAPSEAEKGTNRDQQGGAPGFDFRSRMAAAIETVANACADDIDDFCGKVTPGGGRLAMCIRAHEDQVGRRWQVSVGIGAAFGRY